MFKFIARWCRRLADYLDPLYSGSLFVRAQGLTALWEDRLGAGFGEAKRHQVYSQLIKEFPAEPKRRISHVIESVL